MDVFKVPPCHHLDKLLPHDVASCQSLSHGDQGCQLLVSHLLQDTQKTGLEEHLNATAQTLYLNNLKNTWTQHYKHCN